MCREAWLGNSCGMSAYSEESDHVSEDFATCHHGLNEFAALAYASML